MGEDGKAEIPIRVDPEIADLVPGFLERRRNDVERLREAATRGDYPWIRDLAHRVKGSGETYGFKGLSEIGGALERAAAGSDAAGVRDAVERYAEYVKRVRIVHDAS